MKRTIQALLLITALGLGLAGCSSDPASATSEKYDHEDIIWAIQSLKLDVQSHCN